MQRRDFLQRAAVAAESFAIASSRALVLRTSYGPSLIAAMGRVYAIHRAMLGEPIAILRAARRMNS